MTLLNLILLFLVLFFISFISLPTEPPLGQIQPVYRNDNGILTFSYKVPLRAATNTPCSIRSPGATSTITHASTDIRTSASSTLFVEIGKGTNDYATTTSLGFMTLSANALGTLVSSTTNNNDALIISPFNFVNVRFGQRNGYSSGLNGNCEVIFRVISTSNSNQWYS